MWRFHLSSYCKCFLSRVMWGRLFHSQTGTAGKTPPVFVSCKSGSGRRLQATISERKTSPRRAAFSSERAAGARRLFLSTAGYWADRVNPNAKSSKATERRTEHFDWYWSIKGHLHMNKEAAASARCSECAQKIWCTVLPAIYTKHTHIFRSCKKQQSCCIDVKRETRRFMKIWGIPDLYCIYQQYECEYFIC